jgi:hypothetical protein
VRRLTIHEARRTALAAQGFAEARPTGRVDRRHLRRVLDRMGLIQIDSVNVLVRSQELPLFARLGPHPRSLIADATGDGELFEYWVHEASHMPTAHHHLMRWKMASDHKWTGVNEVVRRRPTLVDEVMARLEAEGPLTAGDLSQRQGPKGQWWDWDDGKVVLEYLFWTGQVSARRRDTDFARLYDLTERLIPPAVLDRPTPTEDEARRDLVLLAAGHLGVGTAADIADYHRQRVTRIRSTIADLVAEGELVEVTVDGWDRTAYMLPGTTVPRAVSARALLSPFDPVVWFRERTERLFDFHYRIEIYTPEPKRRYGYYVLPFLLGDELVGRVDLKADRRAGRLQVKASWIEPGHDTPARRGEVAAAVVEELRTMATWLGFDDIEVADRGDLARAVRAAARA